MHLSRRAFLRSAAATTLFPRLTTNPTARDNAPGSDEDLAFLSIEDLSGLLRRKKVSPVEVTSQLLARIERVNPAINAYITVAHDTAMQQARAAESEIMAGRWRGPLHGVPISLKDNIDTAGLRTTAASRLFAERVPSQDAEVVRRLRAAGAVIVGKANMHQFASGGTSAVSHVGPVRNPWNTSLISGGSSGGSAAAVAAGLCYASIGTDTGGSIRIPAALCGTVGFKATHGRVSIRGVIPASPSRDHVGPLTRTVWDAAAVLDTIAGYDADDIYAVNHPVASYAAAASSRLSRLRLGVIKGSWDGMDAEFRRAGEQALRLIETVTTTPREVELPVFDRRTNLTAADMYVYHGAMLAENRDGYDPSVASVIEAGAKIDMVSYARGRASLEAVRRAGARMFDTVDILVTPAMIGPPPRIDDPDRETMWFPLHLNFPPFSGMGMPAMVVPCGTNSEGLPVAIQIVGPAWSEARVVQIAGWYAHAAGLRARRPAL